MRPEKLLIYTTCPPSDRLAGEGYLGKVCDVARWTEAAGFDGSLIYTDHGLVDPWLVAQSVIGATARMRPLVAVQPVYMHPYSVAKMVASIAHLHRRRVDLNYVAGGFKNDLLSLGDETAHDLRYERLAEYAAIVKALVENEEPLTVAGSFYRTSGLKLSPVVPPELRPGFMVSGSSAPGREVARSIGATAVRYPQPPGEEEPLDAEDRVAGIRIGVIARDTDDEAWRVAHRRFPPDRKGQLTHAVAMQTTDSEWHRQLGEAPVAEEQSPYWLHPFRNYQTFCPYLVGSHRRVADEVARYLQEGVSTIITDVPASPDELQELNTVLELAVAASDAREQPVPVAADPQTSPPASG